MCKADGRPSKTFFPSKLLTYPSVSFSSDSNNQVVVLGDSHTGKTSLVLRFVEGYYREERDPTIGAFFLTKRVTVNSITCKLLLWDTAGQAHFQKLAATYYRDAAAAIFTFDVSQPATLLRISSWLEEVKQKTAGRKIVLVIAACKCDLTAAPGLMDEGRRLAAQHSALFVETSAKLDQGTAETFHTTAQRVLDCHEQATSGAGLSIPVTVGGTARHQSPLGRAAQPAVPNHSLHNNNSTATSPLHASSLYSPNNTSIRDGSPLRGEDNVVEDEQPQSSQQKKKRKKGGRKGIMCDGSLMVCGADKEDCVIM